MLSPELTSSPSVPTHLNPFPSNRCAFFVALKKVNSCVLSSLPPLVFSLLSFRHRRPLFSMVCSLFVQNAGGGTPSCVPSGGSAAPQTARPLFSCCYETLFP